MTRTFAMRVYIALYWLLVLDFLFILGAIMLPSLASSPETAAFLPVILGFLGLFIVAAVTVTFWPAAPGRARLWIVAAVPAVLFLLMNLPYLPYSLAHPSDTAGFTAALPLVAATLGLVAAGIVARRDVRAGRAALGDGSAGAPGRALLVTGSVAGFVAGALLTAQLAAASGTGGAAVALAPTRTATLVASKTAFGPLPADVAASDVLGIFVVNEDAFAHSFDIDELGIHVALPPNSTTAVSLKPAAAGSLAYYCGVPGHREAGMTGILNVR